MTTDAAPRFRDASLPAGERAKDLVDRLTLNEKISQTLYTAPAIPRLDIPEYNWWNECLHGVARAGVATVFPQAIGMAATWNDDLLRQAADCIATEGRARHHEAARRGDRNIYKGLTYWTPNINIFRDPRWGRGHETYGECPFLTARMGVAFVKGLQGDDPKYMKAAACAKHYAVHSGPEVGRHSFDSQCSEKDLWETYLPAFHALVREAGVAGVMGAYNRTNGEPCCASKTLGQEILRKQWGFTGYFVSDCGAIQDIHAHHGYTANGAESAALAIRLGCDLNCGSVYKDLVIATTLGLVSEAEIDVAVERLFTIRFRLGLLDDPESYTYGRTPYEVNDCEAHHTLSLEMSRQSLVLLKNVDGRLPLPKNPGSIAVVGPTAADEDVLVGNYFGTPSQRVTILDGIRRAVSPETTVRYAQGSDLFDGQTPNWANDPDPCLAEGLAAVERADLTVLCLGLSPRLEGEEGDVANSDGGGDRRSIRLPRCQDRLLRAVVATGKPVVLVLTGGSALALGAVEADLPAILMAWYPGQFGGRAVAEALFGEVNPAGRLPVTFYRDDDQLPHFHDYAMTNRTYRYFRGEPLYPFGYGLSYTRFAYEDLQLGAETLAAGEPLTVRARVTNTGDRAGDEVAQLYLRDLESSTERPVHDLRGFRRVRLKPGESADLEFVLKPRDLALVDDQGHCRIEAGAFRVFVGGRQPDARSAALAGADVLEADFTVTGEAALEP
ncbi:MAG: glycoside hydrolase family 3 C-terminal domain-containing protein [Planctomycetota bacterium]